MSFKVCFLNKGKFSLSPIKAKIDLDALITPKKRKTKNIQKKTKDSDEENDLSHLISINPKKDAYINKNLEESDEDLLKDSDNLIISLNTAEFPIFDIYVYNRPDEDFYLHHQVILGENATNFDWIDFDPTENSIGNIAAVVTQKMEIQLWDLDIFDPLEPFLEFKIDNSISKISKTGKPINAKFHDDLVTVLKWNSNFRNLIATGSIDKKILIWDLVKHGKCTRGFKPKIGCIREVLWHPIEPEPLLALGDKKRAVLLDCRDKNTILNFSIKSKGESLMWNMWKNFEFSVGCESGDVVSFDIRKQESLSSFKAHNDSVSELINLNGFNDSLVTCCDEYLKIWKISPTEQNCIAKKKFKDNICSISRCMDEKGIFCCGLMNGDVKVVDLAEFPDALKKY